MDPKNYERVYKMSLASVYPHYIAKVEKKGRTKAEVDEVFFWLTGYDEKGLEQLLVEKTSFAELFQHAPMLNPHSGKIKGVICGDRIEEIEDFVIRNVRYLDKLVDEIAKGKSMEKILRK